MAGLGDRGPDPRTLLEDLRTSGGDGSGVRADELDAYALAHNALHFLLPPTAVVNPRDAAEVAAPFDSPAAVASSNRVASEVHNLRGRLGIEDGQEAADAKRWRQAAGEAVHKICVGSAEGAVAAKRFGDQTLDRATAVFRAVDLDGDGIPRPAPRRGSSRPGRSGNQGSSRRSRWSGMQPVPALAWGGGKGR